MSDINDIWIEYKKTNNNKHKNILVEHYLYLVKIVAGRLYNNYSKNVEFDDLISYGIIGLIDAVDKFDLNRNIKFETYAQIRIRGAIIDSLRKLDWVPRVLRHKSKIIENAINKLEIKYGNMITNKMISDETGIPEDEVSKILNVTNTFGIVSLDEMLNNGIMPNDDYKKNPEDFYQNKEMKKVLANIIDQLPEKEKLVISLYYYDELTYKEISNILGVSESRISQINSKAIKTIRNKLQAIGMWFGRGVKCIYL